MLKRDKLFFLIVLLLVSSCQQKAQREDIYKTSLNISTVREYKNVYKTASDSLKNFASSHLTGYKDIVNTSWKLDSLICFNREANKCVMTFYVQHGTNVSNGINYFYGAKIKGKWYFFRGSHIYLPSELYDLPPDSPLPFPTLQQIAMKEIFSGYLKRGENHEWEINDNFFNYFKGSGWAFTQPNGVYVEYPNKKQIDSLIIQSTRNMWKYKDTLNKDNELSH